MAPPRKPDSERKRAQAVSLTPTQSETLAMMGGSVWLQGVLDRERALIDKGRAALPQFSPARRGPEPGHAMPSKSGVRTHKTRVLRAYGLAHCDQHGEIHYIVAGNCGIHEALGQGSSPQEAWKNAAENLTKKASTA